MAAQFSKEVEKPKKGNNCSKSSFLVRLEVGHYVRIQPTNFPESFTVGVAVTGHHKYEIKIGGHRITFLRNLNFPKVPLENCTPKMPTFASINKLNIGEKQPGKF